jgi:type II secretory pathway component PulM
MALPRRWRDLSPRTRKLIMVGGTFDGLLKIAALVDLWRRRSDQVRGRKWAWATALVFVNSVGGVPIAYFVGGRRRSDH